MSKRRKPTKALEKCAREVKDSDEFVEHAANIADRYRREHALDGDGRGALLRRSLRDFQKHGAALAAWLQQAHKAGTTESDALNKVGAAMYAAPSHAQAESKSVLQWLSQAEQAAAHCMTETKRTKKSLPDAPRIAAEALRATFEHHKLKWSAVLTKQKQSDAVRVLCAIAKSAGDMELTPEQARTVLREVGG